MKIPFLFCAVAAIFLAGCGKNNSNSQSQAVNPANVTNNVLVNEKRTMDKTLDVSYLNQAVQLYNTQEGHYPKTLQDLTPNYVAKLPEVPLGYQLNYDATSGTVTVVKSN